MLVHKMVDVLMRKCNKVPKTYLPKTLKDAHRWADKRGVRAFKKRTLHRSPRAVTSTHINIAPLFRRYITSVLLLDMLDRDR